MTDDIVARLRDKLHMTGRDFSATIKTASEAADEIERLRDENKRLDHAATVIAECHYEAESEVSTLRAEIWHLRAALSRIKNEENWGPDGCWSADSYPDEIARAALTKETNE